jgi:hypothetical protein
VRPLAFLTLTAALAAGSDARCETLFDAFKKTCVASAAAPQNFASVATTQGWRAADERRRAEIVARMRNVRGAPKVFFSADDTQTLVIADTKTAGLSTVDCFVFAPSRRDEDVRKQVAEYAGVPKQSTDVPDTDFYMFVDDGAIHRPLVADEDGTTQDFYGGQARSLMAHSSEMSVIQFTIPLEIFLLPVP